MNSLLCISALTFVGKAFSLRKPLAKITYLGNSTKYKGGKILILNRRFQKIGEGILSYSSHEANIV